jgi:adenylate cyclase
LSAGGRSIPVDRQTALHGFWGPQETFTTDSCIDVLDGKAPPAAFDGKIVLIGAESTVYGDYYPTPYTSSNLVAAGALPTFGVEIHASVVQSFLDGRWYRRLPTAANLAILFLIGLLTALVLTRRSPWQGLLLLLGMAVVVSGSAFLLWNFDRLWINLAAPLALIILNYGSITAADFLQSELERRRSRQVSMPWSGPGIRCWWNRTPETAGANQEIGAAHGSSDIIVVGGQGFDLAVKYIVQVAQPVQAGIDDGHPGAHTHRPL